MFSGLLKDSVDDLGIVEGFFGILGIFWGYLRDS